MMDEKKIHINFNAEEKAVPDVLVEDESEEDAAGTDGRTGAADEKDEEDDGSMHIQYDTLAVPEINVD